jgi:multicomponent Na+:H+ antiporter subunit F
MHETVFYLAVIGLSGVFAVHVLSAVRHPDVLSRVLRMDAASTVLIAILFVLTLQTESSHYLDAALVLGLLAFVGTLVAARFLRGGGLFS